MGREDAARRQIIQHGWASGDAVEGVGIENHRASLGAHVFQKTVQSQYCGLRASYSGADGHGVGLDVAVETVDIQRLAVGFEHGSRDSRLHYIERASRRAAHHFSAAGAQCASGCQNGCAEHAVTAGTHQSGAEVGFAGEGIAPGHDFTHSGGIDQAGAATDAVQQVAGIRQGKRFPAAEQVGVLGHVERQRRPHESEGETGMHDVVVDHAHREVGSHAGGQVDGYHKTFRGVDFARQHLIAASQRLFVFAAEESVDHNHAGHELRHLEVHIHGFEKETLAGGFKKDCAGSHHVGATCVRHIDEVDARRTSCVVQGGCRGEGIGAVEVVAGEHHHGAYGAGAQCEHFGGHGCADGVDKHVAPLRCQCPFLLGQAGNVGGATENRLEQSLDVGRRIDILHPAVCVTL